MHETNSRPVHPQPSPRSHPRRPTGQDDRAISRKLSAIEMRQLFGSLTSQAHGLHGQHVAAIRDKAGSLNLTQLLPHIRGQQ